MHVLRIPLVTTVQAECYNTCLRSKISYKYKPIQPKVKLNGTLPAAVTNTTNTSTTSIVLSISVLLANWLKQDFLQQGCPSSCIEAMTNTNFKYTQALFTNCLIHDTNIQVDKTLQLILTQFL